MMDRRYFLKASGVALASFGLMSFAPKSLHQFANAATLSDVNGKRKILITIFQRGAVDGLNMVVPYGDADYYNSRKTIAVPKPNQTDGAINLDGFFGLHPSFKPLEKFWQNKQLAIVTAAGSPDNTRSHFDAQDYLESGTPGNKSTKDGWLNRVLQTTPNKSATAFRAVSMTQQLPRSLYGKSPAIAMTDLADFSIQAGNYTPAVADGFEAIYEKTVNDQLGDTGKETFEAVQMLKKNNPSQYKPENGALYPASKLGNSLKQIAQLIKAGVGLEVAFAEVGGWDTHVNEGGSRGQLANLLRDFSGSIAALATDLGPKMDDVLILTMSEFGRTVRENGSRGTDHGHGNSMFLLGNAVKGGKVYTDWKGLNTDNLYQRRDLTVTTDFRDVLGEVAYKHFGNKNLDRIFPDYDANPNKFRNVLS